MINTDDLRTIIDKLRVVGEIRDWECCTNIFFAGFPSLFRRHLLLRDKVIAMECGNHEVGVRIVICGWRRVQSSRLVQGTWAVTAI